MSALVSSNPSKSGVVSIDDNEDDSLLLKLALTKAGFSSSLNLTTFFDADEAIAQLDDASRLPSFVLLDLNMPLKSGFDVLSWRLDHPRVVAVPFFILTSSTRTQDIQKAYQLQASGYLIKPVDLAHFIEIVATLVSWARVNHFASRKVPSKGPL